MRVASRTGYRQIIGGDYFGTYRRGSRRGRIFAFDLVMIKGKIIIKYQGKRPVLVISRYGSMRIEKPYRHKSDDFYAISGSSYPTDPGRKCGRQIIVLKSPYQLKFIQIVGTWRDIQRRVKGQRYILMDGGHSVNPWVKKPTFVVRRW